MKKNMKIMSLIFVLLLISASPAQANKDALARAQYMIRQINAELNQLKSSNKKNKADMLLLEEENKSLKKKYTKLVNKSKKNKNSLSGKIAEIKKKYSTEVKSHNETRKQLQEVTFQKKRLSSIETAQKQKLNLCIGNNRKLYEVNLDILSKYENKDMWDSLVQSEPFTKLTQVEIENMVDDYQYSMDDLRVHAKM